MRPSKSEFATGSGDQTLKIWGKVLQMTDSTEDCCFTCADSIVAAKPMGPSVERAQFRVQPGLFEPAEHPSSGGNFKPSWHQPSVSAIKLIYDSSQPKMPC